MLKDFLNVQGSFKDNDESHEFSLNFNVFAKDENEKVLVERWLFRLK